MSYDSAQDWQMQSPAWRDEQIHKCLCTMKSLMENLSGGYSVYRALLTQTEDNDPTAIVLENSLGETPTFSYQDIGKYNMIVTGNIFTLDKTFILIKNPGILDPSDTKAFFYASRVDDNTIRLISLSFDGGFSASDNLLNKTEIEILVYP